MPESLRELKAVLNRFEGAWAWVGQRGVDAFSVSDFVPLEAVFCCDFGEEYTGFWQEKGLFSVEQILGSREKWGNHDLERLWERPVRRRIEDYIDHCRTPIYTVCYRSLAALEKDRRFKVLAPPLALKDLFDDKLRQLELFAALGVKTPPTLVRRMDQTTFEEVGGSMGGRFVVQPPVGSSGENTYFVNDRDGFERAMEAVGPRHAVKLSKYLPVPSLNGHCVVLRTRRGLRSIAACPSVQVVGAPGCTTRAEVYCGNDFSAARGIPGPVREEICSIMEKVGLFMGGKGFMGLFGMDFLLSGDDVLALEINPRFQGSTTLLSLLQLDRGEIPVSALHVMQFMGVAQEISDAFLDRLRTMYRTPYSGAHLIVHSLTDEPWRIAADMTAGIYTLADQTLAIVRNGTTYRDIESSGEWCILGNLPLRTADIHKDVRVAMIQTRESILDSNLQRLGSSAANFVKALQRRCRKIPRNGGHE